MGSCPERARRALEAGCDMVLLCNAAEEVPRVIDALADQVNPSAQLHLIRLRGRHRESWDRLRCGASWQYARRQLELLSTRPDLELEG